MTLFNTQQQLLDYLLKNEPHIQQQLSQYAYDKVSPQTRLGIYRHAYQMRLIEALADNYPSLALLLGDELFQQLGKNYLALYPSQHFSIRYFGEQLSDYLTHTSQQYHRDYPNDFLAEIAQFEWQLRYAFDAADATCLQLSELQAIPMEQWANLIFHLHPSLVRLDLRWNVPQIWQTLQTDENTESDQTTEQIVLQAIKHDYPIAWRIWREDHYRTFFRSLDIDEAWALDAIIQQQNFADICSGLCEWVDEQYAPQRAVALILRWLNDGLIVKVDYQAV